MNELSLERSKGWDKLKDINESECKNSKEVDNFVHNFWWCRRHTSKELRDIVEHSYKNYYLKSKERGRTEHKFRLKGSTYITKVSKNSLFCKVGQRCQRNSHWGR